MATPKKLHPKPRGGPRPGSGRKPLSAREIQKEIEELESTPGKNAAVAAAERLIQLMDTGTKNDVVKVKACQLILDRVLGKPKQQVEMQMNGRAGLDEVALDNAERAIAAQAINSL